LSSLVLPLLCQLAVTPVCRMASKAAIESLLTRLSLKIDQGNSFVLLLALCQARAFTSEQITKRLLHVIE
jgi:hypothetical protein